MLPDADFFHFEHLLSPEETAKLAELRSFLAAEVLPHGVVAVEGHAGAGPLQACQPLRRELEPEPERTLSCRP